MVIFKEKSASLLIVFSLVLFSVGCDTPASPSVENSNDPYISRTPSGSFTEIPSFGSERSSQILSLDPLGSALSLSSFPSFYSSSEISSSQNHNSSSHVTSGDPAISGSVRIYDYGARGNGSSDDSESFMRAFSSVNKGVIVLEKGIFRISSPVVIPEGVTLRFHAGAQIAVDKNITLTVRGKIDAGIQKIFDGEGAVQGIKAPGYPQWFGAKGDGSNDDSAAFTKGVNSLNEMYIPYTPAGYKFADINISKPIKITGHGSVQPSVRMTPGSDKLFRITSDDVIISGLSVTGNSRSSSSVFYFDNSVKGISGVTLDNIYVSNAGNCVSDSGNSNNKIRNIVFRNVRADLCRNIGIYLRSFSNNIRLYDVLVNNLPSGSYISGPGIFITGTDGLVLENVDVAGGCTLGFGGDGIRLKDCQNITGDRIMVDYVNGWSLVMDNCRKSDITDYVGSLYEKGGVYIINSSELSFYITKANGLGSSGYASPDSGVRIENSRDILLENLIIQFNLADALTVKDSERITVRNLVSLSNRGAAYIETGTSDYNLLVSAVFRSNSGSKQYIQTGRSSRMQAVTLSNGNFLNEVTGAAQR